MLLENIDKDAAIQLEGVEVEQSEIDDIRDNREEREKKAGGTALLDVFSSLDLRCFNAHQKTRKERQERYARLDSQGWEDLNSWIFGQRDANPLDELDNPKETEKEVG